MDNNFNIADADDIVIPQEDIQIHPQDDITRRQDPQPDPADPQDTHEPGNPTDDTPLKPEFEDNNDDILNDTLENNQTPADVFPDAEVFTGVAEILKGQGFFADLEKIDDIKDANSLAEAFDKEVQARLTEQQRQIQSYMNQGIPVSEVNKIDQAIQEVNAITDEHLTASPELAERLIVAELQNKGLDEGTVKMVLDSAKSQNILLDKAKEALQSRKGTLASMREKVVQDAQAARQSELDRQAEQQKQIEKALESTEVFGRKVTPTSIQKLKSLANTPVAYTADGRPLNALMKYQQDNPVDFEHKMLYLFSVTNGFKDLKSFDRSAESRVTRSFRDAVIKTRQGTQDSLPETTNGIKFNPSDITDVV